MPRETSDNPDPVEFEAFVQKIPEECRDLARLTMSFARTMTEMDVKFFLGFSATGDDAACVHNLDDQDRSITSRLIYEMVKGLAQKHALPPNVIVAQSPDED